MKAVAVEASTPNFCITFGAFETDHFDSACILLFVHIYGLLIKGSLKEQIYACDE